MGGASADVGAHAQWARGFRKSVSGLRFAAGATDTLTHIARREERGDEVRRRVVHRSARPTTDVR
jgi:hypothetical protein